MARIYTRTGDEGDTSFFDGTRTSKAHARVDLYGDLDELNSWLGMCASLVMLAQARDKSHEPDLVALTQDLQALQADLLEMGAILADPQRSADLSRSEADPLPFAPQDLEKRIDRLDAQMPKLRQFILPGGVEASAALHISRTVCRRVERKAVALARTEPVPTVILATLNRLSDYLFVAARWINHVLGPGDQIWQAHPAAGDDNPPQEGDS